MPVEIRPGVPRDLCFVAANLRDEDRREIFASARLANATEAAMVSWYSSGADWSWTAWAKGQPQAAFGISVVSPFQPHMRSAWAWGTRHFIRCAPAITRFCKQEWPRRLIDEGVTRVEIRSLKGHDLAHRWLAALPARKEAEMLNYGVNGEAFELWAFLKEDWQDSL